MTTEQVVMWKTPETAPRDGSTFLAAVGYPWPVLACWNEHNDEFVLANLQVNLVDGEQDPYFENEYERIGALKRWMPIPELDHD